MTKRNNGKKCKERMDGRLGRGRNSNRVVPFESMPSPWALTSKFSSPETRAEKSCFRDDNHRGAQEAPRALAG